MDEFGGWPYDRKSATEFFSLASTRREKGGVTLISNRGFANWGELLGDTATAAAVLDKLPRHSRVTHPCRESYRLKDRRQFGPLTSPGSWHRQWRRHNRKAKGMRSGQI